MTIARQLQPSLSAGIGSWYLTHRFWLIPVCLTLLLTSVRLGDYRPLTTHETYVAQTAREMWDQGDWLCPRFLGEIRLQKPPLAYWEVLAVWGLTGSRSVAAVRLPSALAAVAAVAAIVWLAFQTGGRRWAFWSGLVQASSVYFLTQARLAEVDMTLTALFYWAMVSLVQLQNATGQPFASRRQFHRHEASGRWFWRWVLWLSIGLMVLAKGPVGPLLLAVTIALFWLWSRWFPCNRPQPAPLAQLTQPIAQRLVNRRWLDRRPKSSWWPTPGQGLLFSLIVLAWPLAVGWQEPAAFQIWLRESWSRFQSDPNGVQRLPGYYLWSALWMSLPWTPISCWALVTIWRQPRWLRRPIVRLACCWWLGPTLFLSCSGGKQEHYLLPALGPAALAAGWLLAQWHQRACRSQRLPPSPSLPGRRVPSSAGRISRLIGSWAAAGMISWLGICLGLQLWLLPTYYGKQAVWQWASSLRTAPLILTKPGPHQRTPDSTTELRVGANPVTLLGHSSYWLAFAVGGELQRCDSLEAWLQPNLANEPIQPHWVLTTAAVYADLQNHQTILAVVWAPADPRLSAAKRPVLLYLLPQPITEPPG